MLSLQVLKEPWVFWTYGWPLKSSKVIGNTLLNFSDLWAGWWMPPFPLAAMRRPISHNLLKRSYDSVIRILLCKAEYSFCFHSLEGQKQKKIQAGLGKHRKKLCPFSLHVTPEITPIISEIRPFYKSSFNAGWQRGCRWLLMFPPFCYKSTNRHNSYDMIVLTITIWQNWNKCTLNILEMRLYDKKTNKTKRYFYLTCCFLCLVSEQALNWLTENIVSIELPIWATPTRTVSLPRQVSSSLTDTNER